MADDPREPDEVHVAGCTMQVDGRVRQRCAWCGAPLLDYEAQDGSHPQWPHGMFVAITGGFSTLFPYDGSGGHPPRSCTALDPAATA